MIPPLVNNVETYRLQPVPLGETNKGKSMGNQRKINEQSIGNQRKINEQSIENHRKINEQLIEK